MSQATRSTETTGHISTRAIFVSWLVASIVFFLIKPLIWGVPVAALAAGTLSLRRREWLHAGLYFFVGALAFTLYLTYGPIFATKVGVTG